MEQKKKGIWIAVLVVVVVVGVTLLSEKKSRTRDTDNDGVVLGNTTTTNTNQVVDKTNAWKDLVGDDKDNDDDEVTTVVADKKNIVSTTTNTVVQQTQKKTGVLYADGTYTAVGSYRSPGGPDELGVTVTLKNDIIVESSVKEMAGDPRSVHFENVFADNYKPFVIGKNIDTVLLDKVSSSSLTPMGFNDAIAQIKSQARKS